MSLIGLICGVVCFVLFLVAQVMERRAECWEAVAAEEERQVQVRGSEVAQVTDWILENYKAPVEHFEWAGMLPKIEESEDWRLWKEEMSNERS